MWNAWGTGSSRLWVSVQLSPIVCVCVCMCLCVCVSVGVGVCGMPGNWIFSPLGLCAGKSYGAHVCVYL